MNMKLTIREAIRTDFPEMIALVESCDLHTSSVQMGAGVRYWICLHDQEIVGVMGMEHNGSAALLRSMAVRSDFRRAGVAARMLHQVAKFAVENNILVLYIFTGGPSTWAERWEFEQLPLLDVADALPGSPQVQDMWRMGCFDWPEVLAWQLDAWRLFQLSQNRL